MHLKTKSSGRKLVVFAVASALLLTAAAFAGNQSSSWVNIPQFQHASADHEPAASRANESQRADLDSLTLAFEVNPDRVHASDKANIKVMITDTASGAPISHVDWAVIIKSPLGNEVYRTSTSHTHVGVQEFSYTFLEPGSNTVHLQVSSLGPKMMGMDVPKEAQTRVFASGDPMKSPEVDNTFFFGTRSHDFVVNVESQGGVKTVASETGKKVKLELSTSPENVVAGQPTTLILNVIDADTGKNIMHPDALISIKQGKFQHSASAPAGSPMMPMNGAYHGHTGEMAVTTIFPTPGIYSIRMEVNSLPVSDVQFGHVKASFNILVVESAGKSPVHVDTVDNQVSILGQAAPYYGPSNMIVRVGQTVTFKNDDFVLHTATSTDAAPDDSSPLPNGVFDTDILGHGQEKQVTFDKAGTYNYFCQIHPNMRGTVTVTA